MKEEFPEVSKEELEQAVFRGKIGDVVQAHSSHFDGVEVDPKELTREDRIFWEKIEDGTITKEETKSLSAPLADDNLPSFRRAFLAFANNMATGVIGDRQMVEYRKSKNQGK